MGSGVVLTEFIPPNREDFIAYLLDFSLMIHLIECLQAWTQVLLVSGLVSSQAHVWSGPETESGWKWQVLEINLRGVHVKDLR